MKRICVLLLMLALWAGMILPAQAAQGDATLAAPGEGEVFYSLAAMEDALYLLAPGGLYVWRPGDAAPSLMGTLPQEGQEGPNKGFAMSYGSGGGVVIQAGHWIDQLLAADGKLYGLDTDQSVLYLLEAANGQVTATQVQQLSLQDAAAGQGGPAFSGFYKDAALTGGQLYLLKGGQQPLIYELYRFDLQSGAGLPYEAPLIAGFAPYTQGKALVLQYASQEQYQSQEAPASRAGMWLNVLDLLTGEITKGIELPVSSADALAYDESTDTAMFFSSGEVYAVDQMASCRLAGYAPASAGYMMGSDAAALPGSLYAIAGEQVAVRSVAKGDAVPRALRIQGIREDSYRAFAQKYPQIPVVINNASFDSAQMLMQDMAGGGSDLYTLMINTLDYKALLEKGYAASLGESETLLSQAKEMYPFIQEELFENGDLMAFPVALSGSMLGYSKKALEELGLTEADLPRTFPEMMDFITAWEEKYGADHPSMKLFDGEMYGDPKDMFFSWLLEAYQAHYQTLGEPLTFDTPLFDKLLASLEAADFSAVPVKDTQQAMSSSMGVTTVTVSGAVEAPATALFTMYYESVVQEFGMMPGQFQPLPLQLEEGAAPVLPVSLTVYLVNPYSPSRDLAMTYLEHFASQRGGAARLAMSPNYQEPVPNPYYEKQKANTLKEQADLQAQLKTAPQEKKKDLQVALNDTETTLAFLERSKWLVDEQGLLDYKQRAQSMVASHLSPLSALAQDQGLAALMQRYMAGQLSRVQLMDELEKKLQMVQREGI